MRLSGQAPTTTSFFSVLDQASALILACTSLRNNNESSPSDDCCCCQDDDSSSTDHMRCEGGPLIIAQTCQPGRTESGIKSHHQLRAHVGWLSGIFKIRFMSLSCQVVHICTTLAVMFLTTCLIRVGASRYLHSKVSMLTIAGMPDKQACICQVELSDQASTRRFTSVTTLFLSARYTQILSAGHVNVTLTHTAITMHSYTLSYCL